MASEERCTFTEYVALVSSYQETEPCHEAPDPIWRMSLTIPRQQLTVGTCRPTLVLWKYPKSLKKEDA